MLVGQALSSHLNSSLVEFFNWSFCNHGGTAYSGARDKTALLDITFLTMSGGLHLLVNLNELVVQLTSFTLERVPKNCFF